MESQLMKMNVYLPVIAVFPLLSIFLVLVHVRRFSISFLILLDVQKSRFFHHVICYSPVSSTGGYRYNLDHRVGPDMSGWVQYI